MSKLLVSPLQSHPLRDALVGTPERAGFRIYHMRSQFFRSLRDHQAAFDLQINEPHLERLADYFGLVQEHNPLLHLVAPCSPEAFASRHILESLTLLEYLPKGVKFADVGAGAGLPSIPCLLVRDDLKAVLIESKEKKAKFLEMAVSHLGIAKRTEIVNRQFIETKLPDVRYVVCRALDKFAQKAPYLLKWSSDCGLLFFGGPALGDEMRKCGLELKEMLMPLSKCRYLFISDSRRTVR